MASLLISHRITPRVVEADGNSGARIAGHGSSRSACVSAKPNCGLARSPARSARVAEAGRCEHAPDNRARIPTGENSRQTTAHADSERLHRVHSKDRRGGCLHVRTAARGAPRPGYSRPGNRSRSVPLLIADCGFETSLRNRHTVSHLPDAEARSNASSIL